MSDNNCIAQLMAKTNKLQKARILVDDGKLSLITLNGLDASYEPFITAQMSRFENINFASLLGLLQSYESLLPQWAMVSNIARQGAK